MNKQNKRVQFFHLDKAGGSTSDNLLLFPICIAETGEFINPTKYTSMIHMSISIERLSISYSHSSFSRCNGSSRQTWIRNEVFLRQEPPKSWTNLLSCILQMPPQSIFSFNYNIFSNMNIRRITKTFKNIFSINFIVLSNSFSSHRSISYLLYFSPSTTSGGLSNWRSTKKLHSVWVPLSTHVTQTPPQV